MARVPLEFSVSSSNRNIPYDLTVSFSDKTARIATTRKLSIALLSSSELGTEKMTTLG